MCERSEFTRGEDLNRINKLLARLPVRPPACAAASTSWSALSLTTRNDRSGSEIKREVGRQKIRNKRRRDRRKSSSEKRLPRSLPPSASGPNGRKDSHRWHGLACHGRGSLGAMAKNGSLSFAAAARFRIEASKHGDIHGRTRTRGRRGGRGGLLLAAGGLLHLQLWKTRGERWDRQSISG